MDEGSITKLLHEVESGRPGAEDRLFERVYAELRALARARLAGERPDAADGAVTDLVHDAYRRVGAEGLKNRLHLFFTYARAMRQILTDRARRRDTLKRGGDRQRVTLSLEAVAGGDPTSALDVIEVAELLERLRAEAEREADIVELRFFGGLAVADIASLLDVSERTVRNDWFSARRRLARWARR